MDENKTILDIVEVLSVIDELVHIYGVALPTTLPRDVRIPLNLLMYRLLSANTTINLNGKTLTFTDNDSEILIEITNTISGKSASFTINELVSIACDAYAITINTTGIELTTDKTLRYPSDLSAQTMDDKDIPPVKWIKENIIYNPTTEPSIVLGTPNILTFDCNNRQQTKFAPRLSVGTLSINVDFTLAFSNTTNTEVISFVLSLTGTRIITFPSGTLAADIPSAYTWSSLALTIPSGTDEVYEFSLNKYGSNWLLRVGGVNA